MRERILEGMHKYLTGQVALHKTNIECLLEQPEDLGLSIMPRFEEELQMLTTAQSKLENLALFTEI